jgi:ABC-type nitrate/sulfonate/bicarbonate transport system substrate-binding protein
VAVTLLAVLTLFAAVATTAEAQIKIAVNATTIESFPVFLAAESLSAAGDHSVQLVTVPNGRAAMTELTSGSVDAATGSETQALLNSVADPRIRIVLTLSECRYRIVARRSAGIRRVSDLRGKRVAVTINTSSQQYLASMLRTANLGESDVQLVPLEGQEMPQAVRSGAVDAVAIWEPHAQNSLEAIGKDAVVFEDSSAYTERFNLNTRSDVLSDPARRLALKRFVQAVDAASARIRKRPPGLIVSLAPHVGLTERTVSAVWRQFGFPATLSNGLRSALEEVEPWVAATQKREPRPKSQLVSLIDSSLLADR